MNEQHKRTDYLLQLWAERRCQPAEREELLVLLEKLWEQSPGDTRVKVPDWEKIYHAILQEAQQNNQEHSLSPSRTRIYFIRRIAAAAAVLLLLFTGAYYLIRDVKRSSETGQTAVLGGDVAAPAHNKAVITLADGRQIYLDSTGAGELAIQGNTRVLKNSNGEIVYQVAGASGPEDMPFNTLYNPRGSQVLTMRLSDGSQVWLNAGSSVRFPVAFSGTERNVSITGEAYFEVAPDHSRPFKVSKGELSVEVLGTHFNVNAYDDEEAIRVTLLEGSVQVRAKPNGVSALLRPGQQAMIGGGNDVPSVRNADLKVVMAWKEGVFRFDDMKIGPIMRQIEKWYDVDVVYQGTIQSHFVATIPRRESAGNVFRILEQTGGVKFKIEGKKVYVMP